MNILHYQHGPCLSQIRPPDPKHTSSQARQESDYASLLEDPQWQQKRKEILERDAHRCKNCGSSSTLQVHHKQYHIKDLSGEFVLPWNYKNHYLITLCKDCHKKGHAHYKVPVFRI